MSCEFTLSNPISSFSNLPTRTRFPQEFSFTSQLTKSRISVRNPSGPRRARARIEALYVPAETRETLYELLGITEGGSSPSDLKKAYRKMARKYHPDVAPPDRVDEHTRRFIMVKEAYETLSDPQTRALYDSDLAGGSGFGFSATSAPYRYDKRMEERGEWRMRWQSQIDELKRRSMNPSRSGRMSWGARMRNQR